MLVAGTLDRADFQMADARQRAGRNGGRQRGREDEARGEGADRIADVATARNVAAHHAETLGQRAINDVDPGGLTFACGDPAAPRTVHSDGVNLVDVGQRSVFLGEVANSLDRRDMAVHRVDALEGDQLGDIAGCRAKQALQAFRIVVLEDVLGPAAMPDSLDHRCVVERIREDHEARNQLAQGR